MSFGETRASRREKVLGGSEEHELGDGEHKWCCDGVGDEGGFWGFCGLVSLSNTTRATTDVVTKLKS